MFSITRKNQRGFTLIELLAVMAIVAVLAGIVSVAVGGTSETSKDTQTKQDATTMETAADYYLSDQVGAEVLTTKTVNVQIFTGIQQKISSRWPEIYITDVYESAFGDVTIRDLTILTADQESTISIPELLEKFNAIDFSALLDGDYLAVEPDGSLQKTSGRYFNYLWLFKKTTAAGGSSDGAARQVAVFKLLAVQEIENEGLVDLTYLQLVGEFTPGSSTATVVPDFTRDEDDATSGEDLSDIFATLSGASSSDLGLVTVSVSYPYLFLNLQQDQNGEATITVLGTDSSGDILVETFLLEVLAVNDFPVLGPMTNVTNIVAGTTNTVDISGVSAEPGPATAVDELASQTLTYTVLVTGATDIIDILSFNSTTKVITYDALKIGITTIQVEIDDGQDDNNIDIRSFTIDVTS